MRHLVTLIILLSLGTLHAQDFTNDIDSGNENDDIERVLILPFKSQFLLSEIDRGLVNATQMEVMDIRKQLPLILTSNIAASFDDSMYVRSISHDLEASNLSYIHHELAYGFEEVKSPEKKKKKFVSLRKAEEQKVKGHETHIQNGQINKDPIFKERYMSAKIKTDDVIDFIKSEYDPNITIILTELDLMKARNAKAMRGFEYIATLHYCIYSSDGKLLEGNKIEKHFNKSEFDLNKLNIEVLIPMAQSIHERSIVYLKKNSPKMESMNEDNDY